MCPADQSSNTTLIAYFQLCLLDPFARTLLFLEIHQYTHGMQLGKFSVETNVTRLSFPEHNGVTSDALGQVYTVYPNSPECYFLRMLLLSF